MAMSDFLRDFDRLLNALSIERWIAEHDFVGVPVGKVSVILQPRE